MKNKTISLRLTPNEYDQVKKIANELGYSVSEYIRKRILGKREKITPKQDLKIIAYELNRIGNNLNQIAKYVNTNKAIDRVVAGNLIKIKEELSNVNKIL
jgi:predicted DNA-binding protein